MTSGRSLRDGVLGDVLSGERRRTGIASTLFVSHQIGEALVPVVAGAAIDRGVVTGDTSALVRWIVLLAVVFAVLSTSWRWGDRILTAAVESSAHRLRLRLTARVLDDAGIRDAPAAGEVVSVATEDAAGAAGVLVAVAAAIAASAALVTAAVVLLVISRPVGAVVLVGMPLAIVALQRLTRPLERRAGEQRADAARAAALATDLISGLRVLKGLRAEREASGRYRVASRRSLVAGVRASRFRAMHEGATMLVTGLFVAVVALVAGREAAAGRMSVGGLLAAVGVTQFLVGPLWRLGFAAAQLATSRASATRVATLLHGHPAVPDGPVATTGGAGAIAFRSVTHRGLVDLDLEVEAGRFVVLAVAEPAEAAALIDLLARREDPEVGRVELDGIDVTTIDLGSLRQRVLVARHEASLFSGTVADNVAVVEPGLAEDRDRLDHVLAAAGAADLHHSLSSGLDTAVGDRGLWLSGGQRQRVALARALAADAPVLVLHDPTTAVDPFTEQAAAAGVRRHRAGRTTIVLATSPALLSVADEVVVIEGGRVVGRGSHHEMLARHAQHAAVVLS